MTESDSEPAVIDQPSIDERLLILRYAIIQRELAQTWKTFESHGINPVLIKGWAVSHFYPKPYLRHLGDFDLAVSPDSFKKASTVVKEFALTKVDLHSGLRHLDSVEWSDSYANSRLVDAGGTPIRVLRAEDHLRVLCVHWLTDGGAYRHKLWDIYHLVNNRAADFDWRRCLDVAGPRRRRWIEIVIGITGRYLELDLSQTPIPDAANKIPEWVIKTVEKEWASDVRLTPIHWAFTDPKQLFRQVKKRIPPNPIQATVELEGDFDRYPRAYYQFANIFTRIGPSVPRVTGMAKKILAGIVKKRSE